MLIKVLNKVRIIVYCQDFKMTVGLLDGQNMGTLATSLTKVLSTRVMRDT